MIGVIILAAGASSRLGHPKQNLLYHNKTLLEHAVAVALGSHCGPVIVVLGANTQVIDHVADKEKISVVNNSGWSEGIASSIRAGVAELDKQEDVRGALIMSCDQPFVSTRLIKTMLHKRLETGKPIIACSYNDTIGIPALFDRRLFGDLLLLEADQGAKKIIMEQMDIAAVIPFDKGGIDIDTIEDYEHLIGLRD